MEFADSKRCPLSFKCRKKNGPLSAGWRIGRAALPDNRYGPLAEWLGRALQKLVQRFESARDLGILLQKKEDLLVIYQQVFTLWIMRNNSIAGYYRWCILTRLFYIYGIKSFGSHFNFKAYFIIFFYWL